MEFLNKIFSKNEISIEDLSYISKLIDTNISFRQTLDLIKNKKNKIIFEKIISALDQGKMIEEVIVDYLPKQIKNYMAPLLKSISFQEALSLSLEFNEKHSKSENKILGEIAYPCVLLFVTITVLYLFDLYGMDTIFGLISSFNTNLDFYKDMRLVFRIIINIFYYGLLLGTLLLVFYTQPKRISLLYVFLSKHFPNSLINTYYSEEFVSLLLICVNRGYKTKTALSVLKSMKSKPIVSFLAFHMDESLLEGESLKEAAHSNYYDLSLSKFIKIANYTNEFSKMLESYIMLAQERITRSMKKYTLTIQLATYTFIGVIVVFIYQILFVPMQALSTY